MKYDAPLQIVTATVLPEWIDYNNHMTEGYYGVAFANASDDFIDFVGMDAGYRAATGGTIYTVESHTNFLRELKLDAPLRFDTILLGYDSKRMHVYHNMYHATEGFLAATFETMMLHYNQQEERVTDFPAEVMATFAAVYTSHKTLEAPKYVGRTMRSLATPDAS